MEKYTIKHHYINKNLNQRPGGKRTPRYAVAHDTGNPDSTALQNFHYFNSRQLQASVHVFIDDKDILVTIPLSEKAWHVRSNVSDANEWAIGVELCYGPSIHFDEAYKRYVWFFAYLCQNYEWEPRDHIKGHYELDPARRTDPIHAFSQYGKTFSSFLKDVAKEKQGMNNGNEEEKRNKPASTILYKVQIGAFSSRENADKLAKKAKAAGFNVFINPS
jgi:N-acetylmuramoyl-L-alanine amidase